MIKHLPGPFPTRSRAVIHGGHVHAVSFVTDKKPLSSRRKRKPGPRCTRVGEGRIVRDNNWYRPGYVVADTLSPQKAALLLSLVLTRTSEPDEVQRYFDEY